MGLKTTNYEIKKLGITVPTAYAIIKNIEVHGEVGKALFYIQTNRDNTDKMKPLQRVYWDFNVDRNENPYITAYNSAKTYRVKIKNNPNKYMVDENGDRVINPESPETIEIHIPGPFVGWEDDIIK